jgi:hypothetical protein
MLVDFTSDERFGLVDIDQKELSGGNALGRERESSNTIILTISGIYFRGLSVNADD